MADIEKENLLTTNVPKTPGGARGGESEGRTTARKTKKQDLIRLLRGKKGADVARLSDKLGWQPHSVRAAMTGLRKDGYDIQKECGPGGMPARYRIRPYPVSSHASGAEAGK